jgi:ribose 5-phosphate isomerase RpiB
MYSHLIFFVLELVVRFLGGDVFLLEFLVLLVEIVELDVGVEVGANKFSGIRASLATNPQIAEYAAVYDKCNVICLVGWDDDKVKVHKILDAWIHAEYDGNEKRLKMFEEFNKWH